MKNYRSMKEVVIHQDSIIKTIKTYFGSEVNKMREYQTPGEPNSHVKSPVDQDKCLSKIQQCLVVAGYLIYKDGCPLSVFRKEVAWICGFQN